MSKELTLSEKIHRAAAAIQVENVMARHCYYHAGGMHREEYDELWTKREDATWAHNFGKMASLKSFYSSYVQYQEYDTRKNFERVLKVYPQVEGRDPRPLNECAMHTLSTPIIEVAEDGQSAKALWYTPGVIFSTLNPQQSKEGMWIWERYGADFIIEDGKWVYLDLKVTCDMAGPMDAGHWAADRLGDMPPPPPPPEEEEEEEGAPQMVIDIPGPLYFDWSPTQTIQHIPHLPEPYATLSETARY